MQSLLDSPEFLQQMSRIMSNPAMVDQVRALNLYFVEAVGLTRVHR